MAPPLRHLAIAVDGNRRWATTQGLPPEAGYVAAVPQFAACARFAVEHNIPYLSFHVFNAVNWARPPAETDAIMNALVKVGHTLAQFNREHNGATVWAGHRDRIPNVAAQSLSGAEAASSNAPSVSVALYIDYNYLEHPSPRQQPDHGFPDFDLYVRPVREYRISGFDPWRIAFAELAFIGGGFPALTDRLLAECVTDYTRRNRTFGS